MSTQNLEYTFQFKVCSVLVEAPCGFRFGLSTAEGLRRNPESISEVTCQLKICSDLVEAPCGFRFGPSTAEGLRRNLKSIMEYTFQFKICGDLVEALAACNFGGGRPKDAKVAQNQYLSTHVNSKSVVIWWRPLAASEAPCGFGFGAWTTERLQTVDGQNSATLLISPPPPPEFNIERGLWGSGA
jgi:hypothetical protein